MPGRCPFGGFSPCAQEKPATGAPLAILFSPHPDDECLIGLYPLRLMREAGWRILNVPVTHGSNPARQLERHQELCGACAFLGWDLPPLEPCEGHEPFPALDTAAVACLLTEYRPSALFVPHERDWNSRHVSTHHLVMNALAQTPSDFDCAVIETEFWGAMDNPNLMVEGNDLLLADLVAATSFHVKEVERNPYHRLLPAWMLDNVRRGGELVGGQGHAVPDFLYATLYRLSHWREGRLLRMRGAGHMVSCHENPSEILHGNHSSA
jgi:LmbE family N-acetylglucosaminyl deacetylase